jgi:succinate-semialdehyde dehydrogenase/glutarate-semialdehyde dehydrogenase
MIQTTNTIRSVSPHTRQVIQEFACATAGDVEAAIALARNTFKTAALDLDARLACIEKLRTLIVDQAPEIVDLIAREVGKPLSESYSAEITGVLDTCTWLRKNAKKLLASRRVRLGNPLAWRKRCYLTHEPLGVIGIISPWNFPFAIPMGSMLAAVAAGNTVVLKPSEKSTLVGLKIEELFRQAGFPEGTVNVIVGDGNTGKCLSESPQLARLVLTGSVRAGQRIVAQTATNLTPVTLELGGKDAAIVLPDAPVEYTSRGIVWGAFTNAGQACASIERLYIVRGPDTERMIAAIVEKTKKLLVGPPDSLDVEVGPIIDEAQLTKIAEQVEQARSAGANILVGGSILGGSTSGNVGNHAGGNVSDDVSGNAADSDNSNVSKLPGYYYAPTVLVNVNHDMIVMREETFGPVLPIMVVDSVEEAVRLANDSSFGLTASVWSNSVQAAQEIAPRLEVGTVYINDCIFSHAAPELPWGGVKLSGIGRSHSHIGLMDMVNIKNVNVDTARGAGRLWWYPYSSGSTSLIRGGMEALHGSTLWKRFRGSLRAIGGFIRR